MKTPCRAAASTSSSPSGALTVLPSSVNSTTTAIHSRRQLRPVPQRRPHRDRRGLAEAADRRRRHRPEPLLETLRRHLDPALEEVVERAVPDPARRALLAGLLREEAHRLREQAPHGVARRKDLHAARPRTRAPRGE